MKFMRRHCTFVTVRSRLRFTMLGTAMYGGGYI